MEYTEPPYELLPVDTTFINGHHHFYWPIVEVGDGVSDSIGIAALLLPYEDDCPKARLEREETAKFLVRACNCHKELLEALKDLLVSMWDCNGDEQVAAEKAIAKAETA